MTHPFNTDMNRILLLAGSLLALSSLNHLDIEQELKHWEHFKDTFNKTYEGEDVERMRMAIFLYNKQRIDSFNLKLESEPDNFELGLNDLSDVSQLEIKARNGFIWPKHELTGEVLTISNSPQAGAFLNAILEDEAPVPDAIDWRQHPGRVSEVKNQGSCGSCWAFASTGTLEGQERVRIEMLRGEEYFKQNDGANLVELSEQNLVDCVKKDYGCRGGFMKDALEFVADEKGIDDEKSYPYEARTKKCRFRPDRVAFDDRGAALLPMGDEDALKKVVAKFGPVAVGIDASSIWFQFYRHGVYYNKHCKNKPDELDHGVLVVGYGTDPKKGDYWIVKNSWGPTFGEKGYIRMARNRNNNCGIATAATIPTF